MRRKMRKTVAIALVKKAQQLLSQWENAWALGGILLLFESVLCALIIWKRPYTKIDWDAYMQEVEGPMQHGQWNYSMMRGETGPLVYPAGFVWLYGALRFLCGRDGTNIRIAQWIFMGVYIATQALVFAIYTRAAPRGVGPWVLAILCISKRLHSIYILRLFNDCWAMLLLYAAVLVFMHRRWRLGCCLYSLAVSIKMNIFLFAPALFLLMVKDLGLAETIFNIFAICAVVQLVLAAPFMVMGDVKAYIRNAFGGFGDLKYKWTVNWKVLPEELFLSKGFGVLMLALTAGTMLYLGERLCAGEGGILRVLRCQPLHSTSITRRVTPGHVAYFMLAINFVGVLFSRSLHFQFYCWYWHAVPLLLWWHPLGDPRCGRGICNKYSLRVLAGHMARLLVIAGLEFSWSYRLEPVEGTSTPSGSAVLQACHVAILAAILWGGGNGPSFEFVACPGTESAGEATVSPSVLARFNNRHPKELQRVVQQVTGKAFSDCCGVALTRVANGMANGVATCQMIDGSLTQISLEVPTKTIATVEELYQIIVSPSSLINDSQKSKIE